MKSPSMRYRPKIGLLKGLYELYSIVGIAEDDFGENAFRVTGHNIDN